PPRGDGYADRELYDFWATRHPIVLYAAQLQAEGLVTPTDIDRFRKESEAMVEAEARAIIDAPWPEPSPAGPGASLNEPPRVRVEVVDPEAGLKADAMYSSDPAPGSSRTAVVEAAPPFDPKGKTFLEGVMLGVGDALRSDPRVFVYGEDVGGSY